MCRTDQKLKLLWHKLAPPDTEAKLLVPFRPHISVRIYVKSVLVSFVYFFIYTYSQHIAVVNSEICYTDIQNEG